MAQDLSKYVFDINHPKDFAAYGLLKKIFKEQNILLVIDLYFFNELFKKEIWTQDVIDEIWDKPADFYELSSNEKMDVYIERFSEEEYFDVLERKRENLVQNSFLKIVNSFFYGIRYVGLVTKGRFNETSTNHEYELITEKMIDIDYLEQKLVNYSQSLIPKVVEISISNSNNPISINVQTPPQNILFLISNIQYIHYLKYFSPKKSSALIVPYHQKENMEQGLFEYKGIKNTQLFLIKQPEQINKLFDLVMRDANLARYPKKNTPKSYFKKIQVKNYYTIKDITLNKISNKKEIYILGENGDGKTLLLQAILMSAKWHQIKYQSNKGITGTILQQVEDNPNLELLCEDTRRKKYFYPKNTDEAFENVFAYGVNRQDNKADTDEYGYMTLFKKDLYLQEPTKWLQYLYSKELEGSNQSISLETAKKLLKDLLEEKVEIEVSVDEVRFTERGSENVKFEQLSDGYKSILIWVCDLVARLARNQPNVMALKDFHGVVLVDEIGLHLHPKWEAQLVQKLTNWFQKIQFIFTTHSPIIILNASKDAVVYRLYKEDGITKISDQYQCSELSDLMANGLITSPLFDLETATMRSYEPDSDDLDTSENYRVGRLRKLIDAEYRQLKKEGKSFISFDMIDNIIEKVLEEN